MGMFIATTIVSWIGIASIIFVGIKTVKSLEYWDYHIPAIKNPWMITNLIVSIGFSVV